MHSKKMSEGLNQVRHEALGEGGVELNSGQIRSLFCDFLRVNRALQHYRLKSLKQRSNRPLWLGGGINLDFQAKNLEQ